MYTALIHRIVIVCGLFAAVVCFIWNIAAGRELVYSAFMSLCVMFAVSIILLVAFREVARVLLKHLNEKQMERMEEQRREAQSKKIGQ